MDRIERWKLAEELNVYQIALLCAGHDPSGLEGYQFDAWPREVKEDVAPFVHAIKNAARKEEFDFEVTRHMDYDAEINWYESLICLDSFRKWLRSRNFHDGFFLECENEADRVSDKKGEFYAPKLAAAVRAWNEVTSDPQALNGKTPKKALEVWLRKHANVYGLTNKDGNPNELGIEEICKVANWKPTGGASPTPTPVPQAAVVPGPTARKVRPRPPTPKPDLIIDDDIPF